MSRNDSMFAFEKLNMADPETPMANRVGIATGFRTIDHLLWFQAMRQADILLQRSIKFVTGKRP